MALWEDRPGTPVSVVGNVSSPWRATVDGFGFLVAADERPGIDWWVGAEDRWHVPHGSTTVRQRLLGDAPAVETAIHVPGGDVLHRVVAIQGDGGEGRWPDLALIEIENRSAVPVAAAIAIRPYDHAGTVVVDQLRVRADGLGSVVEERGVPLLITDRVPAHVAVVTGEPGDEDAFDVVTSGAARPLDDAVTRPGPGHLRANAALVFPLAHTAVLRAVVPIGPVTSGAAFPSTIPEIEQVVRGWTIHADRGSRWVLPAGRAADQLARQRRAVLLLAGGPDGVPATIPGYLWQPEAQGVLAEALAVAGYHEHAEATLLDLFAEQSWRGPVGGRDPQGLATSAALRAAGALAIGGEASADVLDSLVEPVAKGANWLRKRDHPDPAPFEAAAALLRAAGQPDAARRVTDTAAATRGGARRAAPAELLALLEAALDAMGTGTAGRDLDDGPRVLLALRDVLIRDTAPGEVDLFPAFPAAWLGQGLEVHGVPTGSGACSFAVRWHGERPALLWELDRTDPDAAVRLRAPGLDPGWSTTEPTGEALLAAPSPPAVA